jgi:thioredoxin 1
MENFPERKKRMNQYTFDVTDKNFEAQVRQSDQPVLIEFTADWCPPCKMLAPIVNDLAQKYAGKLRVGILDADGYPQYVEEFGIMGLPTLVLFQQGKPVQRIVGFRPRAQVEALILPYVQSKNA